MKKILGALVAAALAMTAQAASAMTAFSFSFSVAGTTDLGALSGSGILTGMSDIDAMSGETAYFIDDAKGTLKVGDIVRNIITVRTLTDPDTGFSNANLLIGDGVGLPSLFDVAFALDGEQETALFSIRDLASGFVDGQFFEGTAQFDVAAVPEPASWAMMLLGFGAIGVAMRRRRVLVAFAG